MRKKSMAIVSLDVRAGRSYRQEVRALFGRYVDVAVYHVEDGSAMGVLPAADLFAISTDAYGSAEEVARHVPMECQTMAVETSFQWSDLHKLKEIPAGEKVLFVNMTQAMAREAVTQLNQFGINHLRLIPFYPGAALEEDVKIAVTPDETRFVPPGIETVIDLGQRACTSGMMIEIALRLGLEFLLETQPFQDYFRGIAANNYSFDQMFARSIRLENQFHILMEILTEGVIGVNERGEIFACSQRAQDITRVTVSMVLGKRGEQVFPYISFDQCLRERRRVEARVEKLHGANISVEVVPVLRQEACVGAFALLERFDEVEKHQGELRRQLLNKVEEGSFRRDLYYRLNTLPIHIPPLSQRGDDVFLLIDHFRDKLGGQFALDEPVRWFLADYPWPGNIRELRSVVEYFIYTGQPLITLEELPPPCGTEAGRRPAPRRRWTRSKRRDRRRRMPPGRAIGLWWDSSTWHQRRETALAGTSCWRRPGKSTYPCLRARSGASSRNWPGRAMPK